MDASPTYICQTYNKGLRIHSRSDSRHECEVEVRIDSTVAKLDPDNSTLAELSLFVE